MRAVTAFCVVALIALTYGCASGQGSKPASNLAQAFGDHQPAYGVWRPAACLGTPPPEVAEKGIATAALPALVGALVPQVLDLGYDWIAAAIETAAKEQTWSVSTTIAADFYEYSRPALEDCGPHPPWKLSVGADCFQLFVLRAFDNPAQAQSATTAWTVALGKDGPKVPADLSLSLLRSLHLDDRLAPVAYFEFRPELSAQATAFRLGPRVAWIADAWAHTSISERKDFAVTYRFSNPKNEVISAGSILFPYLETGTALGPAELAIRQTGWMAAPPLSQESKTRMAQLAPADSGRELLEPFNLTLALVETKSANSWLQKLAALMKKSKTQVLAAAH